MAKRSTLPLLVICFVLAGCGGKPPQPAPIYDMKLEGRSAGTAVVDPGDSLSVLAKRYALTMDDLIRANITGDPDLILSGQRIALPPPRTYTVRAGDSVATIASMFDVTPEGIVAANDMRPPYVLRVGQKISLPHTKEEKRKRIAAHQPRPEQAVAHQPRPPSVQSEAAPVEAVESTPLEPDYIQPKSLKQVPQKTGAKKTGFTRPVNGDIISGYGSKSQGLYNDGINIAAKPGTPVKAARTGTVVYAGDGVEGYGNMVLLKHDDGYFTVYSHLADTRVTKGRGVSAGQTIGTVGASGKAASPQLHFEIRQGTKSLNPLDYF